MASFKQKMSNKAVLFAYDHKQISKRGKRLGDSYKEVKKTIEYVGMSLSDILSCLLQTENTENKNLKKLENIY